MRRDDLIRIRHMLDAGKEALTFAQNRSRLILIQIECLFSQ
jgi:hypothetical protein